MSNCPLVALVRRLGDIWFPEFSMISCRGICVLFSKVRFLGFHLYLSLICLYLVIMSIKNNRCSVVCMVRGRGSLQRRVNDLAVVSWGGGLALHTAD